MGTFGIFRCPKMGLYSVKRAFSTKWWPGEENARKIIFFAFLVYFYINTKYIKLDRNSENFLIFWCTLIYFQCVPSEIKLPFFNSDYVGCETDSCNIIICSWSIGRNKCVFLGYFGEVNFLVGMFCKVRVFIYMGHLNSSQWPSDFYEWLVGHLKHLSIHHRNRVAAMLWWFSNSVDSKFSLLWALLEPDQTHNQSHIHNHVHKQNFF